MPAHHPILPWSFGCSQMAPKVSHTAGNSNNYKKWSKNWNIIGGTYLLRVLCMPAHHPTLPGSYKWAHDALKGSRTAENSKNYEKWSKNRILIELTYLSVRAGHASTPPCTAWSLFWLKSGVSVPWLGGKCDELAGVNNDSSRCHRPVTRPNGYGRVTGENFVTRTRLRDPRTREPARVLIPVIITIGKHINKSYNQYENKKCFVIFCSPRLDFDSAGLNLATIDFLEA